MSKSRLHRNPLQQAIPEDPVQLQMLQLDIADVAMALGIRTRAGIRYIRGRLIQITQRFFDKMAALYGSIPGHTDRLTA
ncbi:MAG: hypothetical protein KDI15_11055, partial [Thiothrix sp.]|nr:hypothetical protein [Thiothrix sp.]